MKKVANYFINPGWRVQLADGSTAQVIRKTYRRLKGELVCDLHGLSGILLTTKSGDYVMAAAPAPVVSAHQPKQEEERIKPRQTRTTLDGIVLLDGEDWEEERID